MIVENLSDLIEALAKRILWLDGRKKLTNKYLMAFEKEMAPDVVSKLTSLGYEISVYGFPTIFSDVVNEYAELCARVIPGNKTYMLIDKIDQGRMYYQTSATTSQSAEDDSARDQLFDSPVPNDIGTANNISGPGEATLSNVQQSEDTDQEEKSLQAKSLYFSTKDVTVRQNDSLTYSKYPGYEYMPRSILSPTDLEINMKTGYQTTEVKPDHS